MDDTSSWQDSESDSYVRKLTEEGGSREDMEINNHRDKSEKPLKAGLYEQRSEAAESGDVEMGQSGLDDEFDTPMRGEDEYRNPQRIGGKRDSLRNEDGSCKGDEPRLHQEVTLEVWIERSKAARRQRSRAKYWRGNNVRYGMSRREYAGKWDDGRNWGGKPTFRYGRYGRRGGRSGYGGNESY